MSKSTAPFLRTPYNYDTKAASDESGLKCLDESLAIQSAQAECDINEILKSVARGIYPSVPQHQPQFGDFTMTASSYHDAMNNIIAAQEAFDALPDNVRERFDNDPALLLAFLEDSKNRDEAVKLGLIPPASTPPVVDLSTGSLDALRQQASEPVGKSAKKRSMFQRASNAEDGDSGEE